MKRGFIVLIASGNLKKRQKKHGLSWEARDTIAGYLFISPWLINFLVFILGTSLLSLVLSFTSYDYMSKIKWIGLDNFEKIFSGKDPYFWNSVIITLKYVFIKEPIRIAIALFIAILLNSIVKAVAFFRTLMYLPAIFGSGVAISVMWRMIFEKDGLVNKLLAMVGLQSVGWLSDPNIALWTIMITSLFGFGGTMLIFLAGLKGVPESYYESATIDGAGSIRKFLSITLPLITPALFFNIIMGIIGSFQTFTGPYVMTNGGPLRATSFYMLNLYDHAFKYHHAGYASALAWILFVIILFFSFIVFKTSDLWVYYEGNLETSKKDKG